MTDTATPDPAGERVDRSADEATGTTDPTGAEPRAATVEPAADAEGDRRRDRLGPSYLKLVSATTVSNLGDGMGTVAYPWLASAVTRSPILVALVVVAQRVPWLVFTLPAGVITDRVDRRKAMVLMDTLRGVLTLGVGFAVLGAQAGLPGPDEVESVDGTRVGLYLLVVAATVLLGMAEVLRDNAGQTLLPQLVRPHQLERANGRMWSVEAVANTFVGPPLGSLLLLVAFSIPFFVDAGTFLVAAALVATIPGTFRAAADEGAPRRSFRQDLAEGVRWLVGHPLLFPMAVILGLLNGAMTMAMATFVLFAQEVMDVGPLLFTVIGFGGAIGGIVGGQLAPAVSKRLGSGTSLAVALAGLTLAPALIGIVAWWPAVLVLLAVEAFLGVLWNVITVSLRQTIIPAGLLGRVNSVYRFFAWGMMPVGAALGGLVVVVVEPLATRDAALRATWFLSALVHLGLFVFGRSRLTTERIEAARAAAPDDD
ncbi:MAG: MFS transporter [Actinomycetota bacterium]|nr:MFS transporter [Actinomycetota bacterium]